MCFQTLACSSGLGTNEAKMARRAMPQFATTIPLPQPRCQPSDAPTGTSGTPAAAAKSCIKPSLDAQKAFIIPSTHIYIYIYRRNGFVHIFYLSGPSDMGAVLVYRESSQCHFFTSCQPSVQIGEHKPFGGVPGKGWE